MDAPLPILDTGLHLKSGLQPGTDDTRILSSRRYWDDILKISDTETETSEVFLMILIPDTETSEFFLMILILRWYQKVSWYWYWYWDFYYIKFLDFTWYSFWDLGNVINDTDTDTETWNSFLSILILRFEILSYWYWYWYWDHRVSWYWDDIESLVSPWFGGNHACWKIRFSLITHPSAYIAHANDRVFLLSCVSFGSNCFRQVLYWNLIIKFDIIILNTWIAACFKVP